MHKNCIEFRGFLEKKYYNIIGFETNSNFFAIDIEIINEIRHFILHPHQFLVENANFPTQMFFFEFCDVAQKVIIHKTI